MLVSSILFATGGLFLKWISWNPLAINGVRSVFGAAAIGIYLLVSHHKLVWNKTVLLGAAAYASMTTLFVMANKMTSAANAIVLQYTCPIWILLIESFLLHRKPQKNQLLVMACVACGILCFFASSLQGGGLQGDLVAVLSGICLAVLFLLNSLHGGDAISSVFFGMVFSALCLGPKALYELACTVSDILVLAYLGAVQVGLAYILFSLATSRISPITASLINGIEPVLNPILVALFWHEMLSPLQLTGAVIVIVCILIYSLRDAAIAKSADPVSVS